jgi:uroporphyrinogen-III synthase
MAAPLLGFTVGVTADRRKEEQAELLRRLGARVVHGPTVRTLPLAHDQGVIDATEQLVADPPDVVLVTTAVGLRGWIAAAESHGLDEPLLAALEPAEVLVRGPKAAGAVITAGLHVDWRAPTEQSAEMLDNMLTRDLRRVRVAVQRDGSPHDSLGETLRAAGADVVEVPVYAWTRPQDTTPAKRLVEATLMRRVDAVTFTSSPAVWNFVAIGREVADVDEVLSAFKADVLACCVGPVCARSAVEHGFERVAQPRRGRLGAMVAALAGEMARRVRTFTLAGSPVTLQGSALRGPLGEVLLTDRERALMEQLAGRPGAVVSKEALLKQAWAGLAADPHAVEVTVGRLRRRLDQIGGRLETVPRRGYRLVP